MAGKSVEEAVEESQTYYRRLLIEGNPEGMVLFAGEVERVLTVALHSALEIINELADELRKDSQPYIDIVQFTANMDEQLREWIPPTNGCG